MNPIDDVYARIQNILNRINEIQNLSRRPPGSTPSISTASSNASGPLAAQGGPTDAPTAAGSSGATGADFASLLKQALTTSSNSAPSDASVQALTNALNNLGGLGDLGYGSIAGAAPTDVGLGGISPGDLGAADIIGTNPSALDTGSVPGSSSTLQSYQMQLLQAIRDLAAAAGTGGANPAGDGTGSGGSTPSSTN